MTTLYLHIGFPKTATTFLQDAVFPKISSISCFKKPRVQLGDRKERLGTRFYYSPQLWREKGFDLFSQVLGPKPQGEAKEDVLISDEGFGGGITAPHPWIPATRPRQDRENGPHSTCVHLMELRKVALEWGFSQVKVIMGIRRQDRKLASGYAQVSDKVKGASQENFERWLRRVLDPARGYYEGGGLHHNYYLFWQKITEAVGAENLLVLPLELLQENMSEYLGRLFDFLDLPEEGKHITTSVHENANRKRNARSSSENTWRLREPMNTGLRLRPGRLFRTVGLPDRLPLRWPDFGREEEIRLTPELKASILNVYAAGNRCLDRVIKEVELQSYDYWPPPKESLSQDSFLWKSRTTGVLNPEAETS